MILQGIGFARGGHRGHGRRGRGPRVVYSYVPSPWTVEAEAPSPPQERAPIPYDEDEEGEETTHLRGLGADATKIGPLTPSAPSRLLWFVLGLAGAAAARQAGLWK